MLIFLCCVQLKRINIDGIHKIYVIHMFFKIFFKIYNFSKNNIVYICNKNVLKRMMVKIPIAKSKHFPCFWTCYKILIWNTNGLHAIRDYSMSGILQIRYHCSMANTNFLYISDEAMQERKRIFLGQESHKIFLRNFVILMILLVVPM